MTTHACDVAVIGGGIAGLWTLAALRARGYHALLVTDRSLGSGQTVHAQGILHGGLKYALAGTATADRDAIRAMPARWRAALAGAGEIDLSAVTVLSEAQHLWSPGRIASSVSTFFAARALEGEAVALTREAHPPGLSGTVYALREQVVDVPSLLSALAAHLRGHLVYCRTFACAEREVRLTLHDGTTHVLTAALTILTAGAGTDALGGSALTQTRPLHMVMARGAPHPLYGHCLGLSARPRLTVTSHPHDGGWVWYLGGELAESGVALTEAALIAKARQELRAVLPAVETSALRYATCRIDRTEGITAGGRKPEGPTLHPLDACTLAALPTKLTLAPALADRVVAWAAQRHAPTKAEATQAFASPPIAPTPWQAAEVWYG